MAASPRLFVLDPLDTLFFREGRAFGPNEATDAQSAFPPTPMTMQGVLRSKLLADHCGRWLTYRDRCQHAGAPCDRLPHCDVQGAVGKYGEAGSLQLRGPWLLVNGRAVLPIPADVMAWKDDVDEQEREPGRQLRTFLLTPDLADVPSNMPGRLRPLRAPAPPAGRNADYVRVRGWMSWDAWSQYLRGAGPTLRRANGSGRNWWKDQDLYMTERRPGLAMEPGRNRHRDHYLYFANHVRVAGYAETVVRVAFECDGVPVTLDPASSFKAWAIGGEVRAAALDAVGDEATARPWTRMPDTLSDRIEAEGCLKIVLLQPAWWENGWYPAGWDPDGGTPFQPWTWVAALVDRSKPVGGWDMARNREKKLRPFVPAGTVFYLKSSTRGAAPPQIWNECLSNNPIDQVPSFASMGYGHALCGVWREP